MNNQEFAPFYVGQEVEAVSSNPDGDVKVGGKYIITAIKKSCCGWVVAVNIPKLDHDSICSICGDISRELDIFFMSSRFRAITPAMEAVTFEKITEQHPVILN